jgi:hypothetical protein
MTSLPLPPCFERDCGRRTSKESCLGVIGCSWCEKEASSGNAKPKQVKLFLTFKVLLDVTLKYDYYSTQVLSSFRFKTFITCFRNRWKYYLERFVRCYLELYSTQVLSSFRAKPWTFLICRLQSLHFGEIVFSNML